MFNTTDGENEEKDAVIAVQHMPGEWPTGTPGELLRKELGELKSGEIFLDCPNGLPNIAPSHGDKVTKLASSATSPPLSRSLPGVQHQGVPFSLFSLSAVYCG